MTPSTSLPDDALKAIFKFLPREELHGLALTNGQFADILVPIMVAKREELIVRIPLTLTRYQTIVDTELRPDFDRLHNEGYRLEDEIDRLTEEISQLESGLGIDYGAGIRQKQAELSERHDSLLAEGAQLNDRIQQEDADLHQLTKSFFVKTIEILTKKSEHHRLAAESLLRMNQNNLEAHRRLTELHYRTEQLYAETRAVMPHFWQLGVTIHTYASALSKLQAELANLQS